MHGSALCALSCLAGLAAGNFVSPGLGKCLDIKLEKKEDGTRESVDDLAAKSDPVNVQLYKCHGDFNQHYRIEGGKFKSHVLQDFCLEAEKISDNSNVHFVKCEKDKPEQEWIFTGDGNVQIGDKCLDVKAEKKDDGSREVWSEIKKHKTVNVHLYKCHNPETTKRVNQLWAWAPFKDGEFVTEKFLPKNSAGSNTLNMGLTKDHTGFRVTDDLISAVCSDSAHKMVTQVGEKIHESLKKIEHGCEDKPEDDLKTCEDEQVAGIMRAKKNVTLFYIGKCAEQVKKDLGKDPPTLEKAHPAADKYEEAHAAEVKQELIAQMSAEMAKKKAGPTSTPEFLCMDEVSKDIEQDGDLVHEHLLEIEDGCKKKKDISGCETKAVTKLVAGKGKVMQDFVDHCLSPMTWSLHAMHPAIDNFGEVHKTEVHDALHEQIHKAMKTSGLESVTEAFSLNRVSLGRTALRSPILICMGFLVAFASLASLAVLLSRRASATAHAEEETLVQAEE